MTRDMKGTFAPKVLRNFISLLIGSRSTPLQQAIDNNSITGKPEKNWVLFLNLPMIFQSANGY
jgi:hypothetical protein